MHSGVFQRFHREAASGTSGIHFLGTKSCRLFYGNRIPLSAVSLQPRREMSYLIPPRYSSSYLLAHHGIQDSWSASASSTQAVFRWTVATLWHRCLPVSSNVDEIFFVCWRRPSWQTVSVLVADASQTSVRRQSPTLGVDQSYTCFMLGLPFLSPTGATLSYKKLQRLRNHLNQLIHGSLTLGGPCAGSTHGTSHGLTDGLTLLTMICCCVPSLLSQTIEELDRRSSRSRTFHPVPYDTHSSRQARYVWLKLLQASRLQVSF